MFARRVTFVDVLLIFLFQPCIKLICQSTSKAMLGTVLWNYLHNLPPQKKKKTKATYTQLRIAYDRTTMRYNETAEIAFLFEKNVLLRSITKWDNQIAEFLRQQTTNAQDDKKRWENQNWTLNGRDVCFCGHFLSNISKCLDK